MADSLSTDLASLRIDYGQGRDTAPRGRGARVALFAIAALLLAGVGAAYAYPRIEASLFRIEVRLTEIALLSPAQAAIDLTATGYVVALQSSKVAARTTGRLARVLASEGDRVQAGQVLATIEDSTDRAALGTARARAQAARARVQAARANLAEAQLRAVRERNLAQRGAAAQASAQDQEARAEALREAVRTAEAEVQAADAEVAATAATLQLDTITAPISGTVVTRPLRPGELVGPGSSPVLELADFTSLVVEADVPEGRLGKVRPGAPVEIVLDAYPDKRFRGEVLDLVPRVNRAKATVPVKVKFVDPPTGVLPEMAARVSLLRGALDDQAIRQPPRLVVPAAAVRERDGERVVFAVEGEGDRVRMVPVVLGPAFGGGFEVRQGPPAGTRVVSDPPATLRDGYKIKERND